MDSRSGQAGTDREAEPEAIAVKELDPRRMDSDDGPADVDVVTTGRAMGALVGKPETRVDMVLFRRPSAEEDDRIVLK